MNKFDCKELIRIGKCHSDCCGCVSIPKDIYDQFKHLAQREIKEIIEFRGEIYPITEEFRCIFLKEDLSCIIYKDRPEVCRTYGTVIELQCPYFNLKGNLRSPAKQRRAQRQINHSIDAQLKIIGKRLGDNNKL